MSKTLTSRKRTQPVSPETSKRMARTAQRDNVRERALRAELHRRGLRFRLHRRLIDGTRRSVDIVFPAPKIAVFVDGCFWHGCPTHGTWPKNNAEWWRTKIDANIQRDRNTDSCLKELGWTVIRVWEHEPVIKATDRIEQMVRACQRRRVLHP
jgi:DNA mismatch endonuclease, patch repair protein